MLVWLIRLALGGVFAYAGISKLADPATFTSALRGYGLLPEVFTGPLALALPSVEIALALGLVFGLYTKSLSRFAQALLVLFSCAVIYRLATGTPGACGCFGPGEMLSWRTVARNVGLVCLAQVLLTQDAPGLFPRRAELAMLGSILVISVAAGAVAGALSVAPYTVVGSGPAVDENLYVLGAGELALESLRLSDLTGRSTEVPLARDASYLLLFADVRCPMCGDVAVWLERNTDRLPEALELVIVATGATDAEVPASFGGGQDRSPLVSFTQARDIVKGWGLETQVYLDLNDRLAARLHLRASSALLVVERRSVMTSFRLVTSTPVRHPDAIDLLAGTPSASILEESPQDLRPARTRQHPKEE